MNYNSIQMRDRSFTHAGTLQQRMNRNLIPEDDRDLEEELETVKNKQDQSVKHDDYSDDFD